MSGSKLKRSVSLPAAAFIVIGYVVGATIFVLPGSLAADTGPAVFLAYALAAIPAVVAGFVMAQIGSVLPVSGSIYVLLRDALSPHAGFLYQWIMVSMGAVVIPLVAFGFAGYLEYFVTGLNEKLVAATLTVVLVAINLFEMKVAARAQSAMVLFFLAALFCFGIAGVLKGDTANLQPLFPNGYSVLGIAAITAYFSYAGVFVIAEIAGEIKSPGRNIPRAILISFSIIIALYVLVPLALSMVIPWQEQSESSMAVVTASELILPAPLVSAIAISALLAAATTINSFLMGLSRDFFQGANSGLFPAMFAVVDKKTDTPVRAVLLIGALSLIGIAIGGAITSFAQLALIGLMIIQILTGIALVRLPTRLAEAYADSSFKLSTPMLWLVASLYVGFSVLFLFILASEKTQLLLIGFAFLLLGGIYKFVWSRIQEKNTNE